ncbi:MAG TPA: TraB/GumN family protein [Chitinophagaceae bacterium]
MNHPYTLPRIIFFLPLLVLMQALQIKAQDKQIDNALLWKVTGKTLLKPSFLFGTIHLQDQRVFNFNDSLYRFIQSAEGFAMEIHPDSVISALMEKADETASDKLIKKYLKKDEFDQLSRKLKKDGIDAGRLTLREAYLLRDHLSKPEPRSDDMPTFVDAYLFGMAKNQGKEIVGLEKATDQVNMLDDLKGDFDVKELLKGRKKEKTLTERLIQLYIREDLRAIQQLMSYLPQETEDKLLTMRNLGMVSKMDSLIQSKSFVVAVGTAHLPGEQGMIELLRRKGYTVEPVFTKTRTHANNYAIKAEQKLVWVDVKEPKLGYSVRMPGKPSPMDMMNGGMKMNMYMDLTTMKLYYTAFVVPGISVTKQNADSILQSMSKNAMATSKGQAISNKRFTKDNFEGIDFVYKQTTDKMFARVQALAMGKRVYLVGVGSPKQEDLHSTEANDFFKGFLIEDMHVQAWETHSFNDYHFKVSLPAVPKIVKLPVTDSSVYSVQINTMETTRGSFFGVTIVTANPSYVVPDDSVYFASAVERLQENMEVDDLRQKDTLFQGFNARRIHARLKGDLWLNCLMIGRGNRIYNLMSIGNVADSAHADVHTFFESFALTDYPKVKWYQKTLNEFGLIVPVSSEFSKLDYLDAREDSAANRRNYQWLTYDSSSATTFFITRNGLSPYLWVKHDSILLKKYMEDLTDKGEVRTGYRFVKNGGSKGIEFNIRKPNTSLSQTIRVLINGQALYVLQTDVPHEYLKNSNYQQFLENFRFVKEESSAFLASNSFKRLLTDLRSADSVVHSRAYDDLSDMIFDSTDIEAILKAMCTEYVLDTLHYYTVPEKLQDALVTLRHPQFTDLVVKQYNSLDGSQEKFKYALLEVLARHKTAASYELINKLLKQGIPASGDAIGFTQRLRDSILLTKKLYPQLLVMAGDTVLGSSLFNVHREMLDSNLVSVDEFRSRQSQLFKVAKRELEKITHNKEEEYYSPGFYSLIYVLGQLKTDSARQVLRQFMNSKPLNVKYIAAVQLLKNHQQVDAITLQSLASDKDYRISLYDELKELNQEKLFPARFFNQKAFSESYLHLGLDEDSPEKLSFVGERVLLHNGRKQKFFLYKATFEYEGKQTSYLGISGPFKTDGKTVTIDNNISGVYWEEEFRQSFIDSHLKAYMSEFEETDEELLPPPPSSLKK